MLSVRRPAGRSHRITDSSLWASSLTLLHPTCTPCTPLHTPLSPAVLHPRGWSEMPPCGPWISKNLLFCWWGTSTPPVGVRFAGPSLGSFLCVCDCHHCQVHGACLPTSPCLPPHFILPGGRGATGSAPELAERGRGVRVRCAGETVSLDSIFKAKGGTLFRGVWCFPSHMLHLGHGDVTHCPVEVWLALPSACPCHLPPAAGARPLAGHSGSRSSGLPSHHLCPCLSFPSVPPQALRTQKGAERAVLHGGHRLPLTPFRITALGH